MNGMDQPPDEAGEMIAMQMRYENRIDTIGIDPFARQAKHGRGPAINQASPTVVIQQECRLKASATAECVTAPDHRQFHCLSSPPAPAFQDNLPRTDGLFRR